MRLQRNSRFLKPTKSIGNATTTRSVQMVTLTGEANLVMGTFIGRGP